MFAYFFEKLDRWIEHCEERYCTEYLSRSSGLADLEVSLSRSGY